MRIIKLDNGITVLVNNAPNAPGVYIDFRVLAGSRYERIGEYGIAHFCEHMMFRGTAKMPYTELRDKLYVMGDTTNAYTSIDEVSLYSKFLYEDAISGVELLRDMMFKPCIKADDFLKEKEVILQEYQMVDDQYTERLHEHFYQHAYPSSPLSHAVRGDLKQLKKMTHDDLKRFWAREIRPGKTFIGLTSDFKRISLNKILALLKTLPEKPCKSDVEDSYSSARPVKHFTDSASQVYFIMVKDLPNLRSLTFRESVCLSVIDAILGGSPHSRLFTIVRDQLGLTYDIGSSRLTYNGSNNLAVSGSCSPSVADDLISNTHKVWSDLVRKGITKDELEQTKRYHYVNSVLLGERPSYLTSIALEQLLSWGRITSFKTLCNTIAGLTLKEVNHMLQKEFYQAPLSLVTIGPTSKILKRQFNKHLIL